MRIIHLLAPAPAGGLERVVQALAVGQHRRGHDIMVVPVADEWSESHPFAAPLRRASIAVEPIVVGARAYRQERRALDAVLDRFPADVVHSHGYHTNVVDGPVVRRRGIATVGSAHGFTRGEWRNRFYEWLDCRALSGFDATIAVSRPLATELARRGVPQARLHVVPNAFIQISPPLSREEARVALGIVDEGPVVGWVGRMTREKGLDVFIDAMCHVRSDATACIVGDGAERKAEEIRAATLGLERRLHWTGLTQEAGRFFNAFDVLCQSSRTEGIPMVVLEAMAMGIPLVVTGVGGVPDVVSPAEARIVVSEDPVALARAIDEALADRGSATQRAQAAQRRLTEHFSEQSWLDSHEMVYQAARHRREHG